MNANVKLATDLGDRIAKEIKESFDQLNAIQNKYAIEYSRVAQEKYIQDKSTKVQKVFLIFGKLHNFSQECAEFKYNLTEVNFTNIVTPSMFGFFNKIDAQVVEREVICFPLEEFKISGEGSCLEA